MADSDDDLETTSAKGLPANIKFTGCIIIVHIISALTPEE
jgi:hypothetical protein